MDVEQGVESTGMDGWTGGWMDVVVEEGCGCVLWQAVGLQYMYCKYSLKACKHVVGKDGNQ